MRYFLISFKYDQDGSDERRRHGSKPKQLNKQVLVEMPSGASFDDVKAMVKAKKDSNGKVKYQRASWFKNQTMSAFATSQSEPTISL